ncbi:MAG: endolytic transglycosylase MltG, partial [Methylocystis sp.]|nr:endolytic transglycosylase MltG [Methylocystis sp.]
MSDAPNDSQDVATDPATEPERENASRFFRRRASLRSPEEALQPEAPPLPPRRSKQREGSLSALSGFLSFLLVLAVGGALGLIAAVHKLREPGPLAADKLINIAPRADVPEILSQLERAGVIDSPTLMNVALLAEGGRGKLKPGEYLFKQNASLREVMDELVNGRVVMHAVTIPEGLTSEQIVQRLHDNDVLAGDVKETPKEGALLPETYKVARGYPRSKLLAKMQEDQRRLLERIWSRRAPDLPVRTPFELVTLASIVEKETGQASERPRVAGVFVNRLRKGMRLQSDPTIVYGIAGGKATLGRGILRSEVEKWTPYNTDAIDGLPAGPITNPGRAALEAAANPSHTLELYFVADGTGGHVF